MWWAHLMAMRAVSTPETATTSVKRVGMALDDHSSEGRARSTLHAMFEMRFSDDSSCTNALVCSACRLSARPRLHASARASL